MGADGDEFEHEGNGGVQSAKSSLGSADDCDSGDTGDDSVFPQDVAAAATEVSKDKDDCDGATMDFGADYCAGIFECVGVLCADEIDAGALYGKV